MDVIKLSLKFLTRKISIRNVILRVSRPLKGGQSSQNKDYMYMIYAFKDLWFHLT